MTEFELLVGKDRISQIKDLFNKITSRHEFEFMFFNYKNVLMTYDKFITVMKYLKSRSRNNLLEVSDTLDIVYRQPETFKSYRITISGINDINRYMKMVHKKKNHIIYNVLASLILEGDEKLEIMLKTKDAENVVDIDDLNIRARLSEEVAVEKDEISELTNLQRDSILDISFRLKHRVTLYVMGGPEESKFVKIDLTTTKTTKSINRIEFTIPRYELEIECSSPDADMNILKTMLHEIDILLKIIQQSNFIITKSISENVLDEYAKILTLDRSRMTNIDGRQAFSLEIQHVTEILPNRYAVTDKADGDRYHLIIINNHVYLISTNLVVKDSGIDIPDNMSKYNGSILDGELIFLTKKNRHLYMVFDCLFNGNKDVRKISNFMERLENADEIIQSCFVFNKQSLYQQKSYSPTGNEFNLKNIIDYNEKQIIEYMNDLNKNIDIEKRFPLIRRKYFIEVVGAKPWEIFAYSVLIYDKFTNSREVNCPYLLDGLIYHPLDQQYITNVRESKFVEYKWKPPNKNSIDFFVQFEKDKDTGKVLTIYDNSVDEYVKNKQYRICHLYVGHRSRAGEQPVLFRPEEELYLAYIFLDQGEVRDLDGNIIIDKTVVEFYYNTDPDVDDRFRWVPIRTRYDKTESVLRYRKRYGNYIDVANKVWRSINNPILMSDMEELSKGGDIYEKKMNQLRSRIGHELIVSATRENIYYQLRTNLAKPMRQFHNWIKSIIIYTYCHPMYQNERQLSILDIACGRGGDIMKFYYSKCLFYVGLDIDKEGLVSAVDGAISRYTQLRKTHPNFPEMTFIQADAGALLNFEDQNRVLGGMSNENRKAIERFFSDDPTKKVKFDRVNCQFAMHYFLKNDDIWRNFKQNLNMHLKPSGYLMITVFDAKRIMDLFKDGNDKYTVTYTNNKGEKKILFEIIKRYDDDRVKTIKTGNTIDLHAAWMFKEGQYVSEYLVDKDFIISELLNDCDLELVDTDLFDNQYEIHREYFNTFAKYDENLETRKFLLNVAKFYEYNEINGGCFKYTKLERYYIFRKLDKPRSKVTKSQKTKQSRLINPNINGLINSKQTIVHDLDISETGLNTYGGSIHHILKKHKLIPKNVSFKDFVSDFRIPLDKELDSDDLENINKNIIIDHIIENKKKNKNINVLNGITTYILEKDCNNIYDVDVLNKGKNKCMVLLKEGNIYRPVYRSINRRIRGIYNDDDEFIRQLDTYN